MSDLVLHNYYRSSTSFRVRAALGLKGLEYDYRAYHLRKGEQRSDDYLALNPQGLVPTLSTPERNLSQSLAIIEYLDETYPQPPLLPPEPLARARVRSLAMLIGCDIHPVNNLRVLGHLKAQFGADDDAVASWFGHWVTAGFEALERRLANEADTGDFCHGDTVGLADICLAGQVINNVRFGISLQSYPSIERVFDNCMRLDAFRSAHPSAQPDAE